MKKHFLTLAIMAMFSAFALAQPGSDMKNGKGQRSNNPDKGDRLDRIAEKLALTDSQKSQLEDQIIGLHKATQPIKNQLNEKRASLKSLTTTDNVDIKKVNQTIEAIGELETSLLKAKINHQIAVRSMLDDKQKMIFDQSKEKQKRGPGNQRARG